MKILALSYAFPPLQVPMSPVVYKYLVALTHAGANVEVITVNSSILHWPQYDNSLDDYIVQNFNNVSRLELRPELGSNHRFESIVHRSISHLIDPMDVFKRTLQSYLQGIDLKKYDAVITFSPFHSINMVLNELKKIHNFKWIVHFCDPWYMNPFENIVLRRWYAYFCEKKTLRNCDGIIHTSSYALNLMIKNNKFFNQKKKIVIPHTFIQDLYPNREKKNNKKIIIRHLGTLFHRFSDRHKSSNVYRSPEVLFKALKILSKLVPKIDDYISVELIGKMELIKSENFRVVQGLCKLIPPVSYLESLELMYDADILLLIEANCKYSYFFPSKLSDYIGSGTDIIGIVPEGIARNILDDIGHACIYPDDVDGLISILLERIILGKYLKDSNSTKTDFLRSDIIGTNYIDYIKSL